jgi:hypothetical protein
MPETTKVTALENTFLQGIIDTLEAAGETVLASVLQGLIGKIGTLNAQLTEKTPAA